MRIFSDSELFLEPLLIEKELSDNKSEMTTWQKGFLCGLIKEKAPKKVVEIGVSAGGTSAVIYKCLSMLELNTEYYSLDLCRECYCDRTKPTGYLLEEIKNKIYPEVKHALFTGGFSVEFLEQIGNDIDFLIIDTVHYLPGEILDFLACFPFLTENATVVLHDVNLHHLDYRYDAYSTRVLYDAVVADKIQGKEIDNPGGLSNIAAFSINLDTKKYIENVIDTLGLSWKYELTDDQLKLFMQWIQKHYSDSQYNLFCKNVVAGNERVIRLKDENAHKLRSIVSMYESVKNSENVYIFGAGSYGKQLKKIFNCWGINIKGFIVSDGQPTTGRDVQTITQRGDLSSAMIIVAVSKKNQEDIGNLLEESDCSNVVYIDEGMCNFLGNIVV